jgi:arylsulfatase A-like enzyme
VEEQETTGAGAEPRPRAAFWPALWLGAGLVAPKVWYAGLPEAADLDTLGEWARRVLAIAHEDLVFAAALGLLAALALRLARRRPVAAAAVHAGFLAVGAASVLYAVANLRVFEYLHGPLTYSLFHMAGEIGKVRSSIGAFVSAPLVVALAGAPLLFLGLAAATSRVRPLGGGWRLRGAQALGVLALAAAVAAGRSDYEARWHDRRDRQIARNPHAVLLGSVAAELLGRGATALPATDFPAEFRGDFEPLARLAPAPPRAAPLFAAPPPRNLIVIVLESVAARWLSVYGCPWDPTPKLAAEMSAHGLVFDGFYAHVGQTANSLVAIELSEYPGMSWHEATLDAPRLRGRTLAEMLRPRGLRTAFISPGDLDWAGESNFLKDRGYDEVDYTPEVKLSAWGGEDRYLVDGILGFIDRDRSRPFYVKGWSDQTHHPYELAPGSPEREFFREADLPPDLDAWGFRRYLNTLAELDRQLARLFDGLRERGLADDTLVVFTGDHGEGFGWPHRTWGHGFGLFQENVLVPLMIWSPRFFPSGARSGTIGSHVDLNATIADVIGLPPDPSWQGRSLFDPRRPPRAYFLSAAQDYLLGVREDRWKYIFDATEGREELYDLAADPDEQRNLADREPDRCHRCRQRVAAWVDFEGRHFPSLQGPEGPVE